MIVERDSANALDDGSGTIRTDTNRKKIVRASSLIHEPNSVYATSEYRPASCVTEQLLIEIWESLLCIGPIGVDDNFFQLGGDSIISLHVLAKASEHGIKITPQQLFEFPSVASLSKVADTRELFVDEISPDGMMALTASQYSLLNLDESQGKHSSMVVVLVPLGCISAEHLKAALQWLFNHHDILRSRFDRNFEHFQQIIPSDRTLPFSVVDVCGLTHLGVSKLVSLLWDQIERSLDTFGEANFRAFYFQGRGARESRLVLVAHRLIMDGPSWRILLDDLSAAYESVSKDALVRLPRKTTSYRSWGVRLKQLMDAGTFDDELDYWNDMLGRGHGLPTKLNEETKLGMSRGNSQILVELDEESSKVLISDFPRRALAQVQDAVLASLVRVLEEWTDRDGLLIELEGQGRGLAIKGVDLSRSVGQFTAMYPLLLAARSKMPLESVAEVRRRQRSVPSAGLGYCLLRYVSKTGRTLRDTPRHMVRFAYRGGGDLGQETIASRPFAIASSSHFVQSCFVNYTPPGVAITALISAARLQIRWVFSSQLLQSETIKRIANAHLDALKAILSECFPPDRGAERD